MERQRSQEHINDELRREDIKLFWSGFQIFRFENPQIEIDVAAKIKRKAAEMRISGSFEGAIEASMLFLYSVDLAREMKPAIARKVPVPAFQVTDDDQISFCRTPAGKEMHGPGVFEASLFNLLAIESAWSYHVIPWHEEKTATVSEFLPDWVIVDIAVGAPEECAHDLFCNLKTKRAVKKAVKEYKNIGLQQAHLSKKGFPEMGTVHYHTSDIERRGLIWKRRFMEKYFPNWAYPTRYLDEKVGSIRYFRNSAKKPNFWQKLIKHF